MAHTIAITSDQVNRDHTRYFMHMRIKPLLAIGSIFLSGCNSAQSREQRIVRDAAAALGGVDAIRETRTMIVEGGGDVRALGQNRTLDGPLLKWDVTGCRRAIDFEHERWRDESTQTPAFVTGWPDPAKVIAAYDANVAFDVEDGEASRLDALAARERRAEVYHHPIGFLRAALAGRARLERARTEGNDDAVDLIVAPYDERFTLYVDRVSHLPLRIVSKSHVAPLGDVAIASKFGELIDAATGGVKVPGRMTKLVDDTVIAELRITKAVLNPSVDALGQLNAPASVRGAPDSRPARVSAEEIAPGIWYVTGEGHHSVVVEFADHLTLVEAPSDDTRTLAVIARARELRPGKPLTQVINTHHHFDHSGGLRAAIAEGLTVIAHEANRTFYQHIATRPSTIAPDALAKQPKPLAIETVSDTKVLSDGTRRLEIHAIADSPHCAAFLMVYLPKEKLLVEADAYQPPPLAGVPPRLHPFAANLLDNIRRRNLQVDRILPIHGRIVPFANLVAAARTAPLNTK
jgi:glyoxylase-like metal-dependent hydrolase (beta-lactamase superfamily II)